MNFVEYPVGNIACLIDTKDLPLVSEHTWWLKYHRNSCYAVTDISKKRIYMHRLIIGAKKGQIVDHIDGNGMNNRRLNLRLCTNSQNIQNQRNRKLNGKYRGVSWSKERKLWHAKITVNYKTINLGRFETAEAAARAYDEAATKYFKKFAVLNFIEGEI